MKQAHVGAIMDSYNLINGQHATQNGYVNTEIVRKEWGFDGVMMSDWVATYDGVATANGGRDLEMPTRAFMNRRNLLPAIADGRVKQGGDRLKSSPHPAERVLADSIVRRAIFRFRPTTNRTINLCCRPRVRAWCC